MLNVIKAEILKYRRTSALFLAVGIPFAINLLFLLAFFLNENLQKVSVEKRWDFFLSGLYGSWAQLFLPVGLGILAALALGLEHQENQWKQILALGVTRVQVYFAKWLAVMWLVLLGSITLGLGSLLVGGIITGFQAMPWTRVLTSPLLMFLGSAGIISVQVWLATRYKAFAVSTGVALFGAIAGGLISNSARFWYYFPWTYPAFGLDSSKNTWAIGLSLAVAFVALVAATRDFQKRDML
jgi:lantibiotic transport system permease protein